MNRRVILVTGSAPPDACGVGDYTDLLASALQDAGQSVEVMCHRDWNLSGTFGAARKLLVDRNSLVHMQYPTMGYGYSLGPQLCLSIRRGVVTLHEFSMAHPLRKLSLIPFALRSPLLVVTSEFEKLAITQKMPWVSNRLRVIPIGSNIRPSSVAQTLREESVAYFGLIMPRKGLEDFLEFARLIRARGINWPLLIIGKVAPKQEVYAERLIDKCVSYGIRLILDQSAEEVSELLSRTGLGYLPFPDGASDRRGSLKAAFVSGLPCITTSSEQTPGELAPLLVLASTPKDAVEHAIRLMVLKEERARLTEQVLRYSKQFAWERIAELHINLYRELEGTIK